MKIAKDAARTRAASYRDRDRSCGRSATVIPFLHYGVVDARADVKQRIDLGTVRGVCEHAGRRVDSHGGDAAGAGGTRRRQILRRGTLRAVGPRGARGYLPTGGPRNVNGDRSAAAATAIVPRLHHGLIRDRKSVG